MFLHRGLSFLAWKMVTVSILCEAPVKLVTHKHMHTVQILADAPVVVMLKHSRAGMQAPGSQLPPPQDLDSTAALRVTAAWSHSVRSEAILPLDHQHLGLASIRSTCCTDNFSSPPRRVFPLHLCSSLNKMMDTCDN